MIMEAQDTELTEVREEMSQDDEHTGDERENRSLEEDNEKSRVPDGGFRWMVALGALIVSTMVFSVPFSFGILFSGFLQSVGTSATTTAWIYNLFMVLMCISGAFTNPLALVFGRRSVGFVSIFLCSLSTILSAFSPSVYFLFFSHSLIGSVGAGLGIAVAFTALPPYFDKKGGRANTFLICGSPMSQMVFAPLLRYLLKLYSYRGAALIYSAILLNGLIGVAFFHPIKWHLKPPQKGVSQSRKEGTRTSLSRRKDLLAGSRITIAEPSSSSPRPDTPPTPVNPSLQSLRRSTHGSTASVMSVTSADMANELDSSAGKGFTKTLCGTLRRVAKNAKADMVVARHLRAVLLAGTNMITQATHYNFVMLLPFLVRAADHSLQDAAWCISLAGVANLVVRLVLSPLADWKRFSIRASLMAGYCLKAAAFTVASLTSELWLFSAAAVMFGVGVAASVAMFYLSNIKYMGMELFAQTYSFSSLLCIVGFVVIGPLIGVIRDASGSYAWSLWVMAVLDLLSAGLWLLMPAAQAWDARRK